jgi:hypothetical protein
MADCADAEKERQIHAIKKQVAALKNLVIIIYYFKYPCKRNAI